LIRPRFERARSLGVPRLGKIANLAVDKARTAYQDFLGLWKDADADILLSQTY